MKQLFLTFFWIFSILPGVAVKAQNVSPESGAYVASRLASFAGDYEQAAYYFDRLLQDIPANSDIAENAMIVFSITGNFARAAEVAQTQPSSNEISQIAQLVTIVDFLTEDKLVEAQDLLKVGSASGSVLDGLLLAWTEVGLGQMSTALRSFDRLAETESFSELALLHKAYALSIVGDLEGAEAILSGVTYGPIRLDVRGLATHAQILQELERPTDAVDLLERTLERGDSILLSAMLASLRSNSKVRDMRINSPKEGMAEAFHTLATVYSSGTSEAFTLLHSRAAMLLDPSLADAALLSAEVFEEIGQYNLALDALDTVPKDHPNYISAVIARAEILFSMNEPDKALEVLHTLSKIYPDEPSIYITTGDINRRTDNFEAARLAYRRAIELFEVPEPRQWFVFYTRGITNERTGRWQEAEADFERALALNPGHPLVLNYYGYSLVEQRRRLDEALEMIERAVDESENDGFIIDSLGWVLYRLGRYDEAVEPMERAVALEPLDPVINDHLGDVYWKVGRKREAEFQWKRALSFIPEPNDTDADPDRIRSKLLIGLDKVLSQEADPDLNIAKEP